MENEELAAPPVGWSLLRVNACGICGTDAHLFSGMTLPRDAMYPLRPGHEVSGTIVTSDTIAPGTTVLVHPLRPCQTCLDCRTGKESDCKKQKILGIDDNGGMADFLIWPSSRLIPFRKHNVLSAAIIPDAVTTAYHALKISDFASAKDVCVIGAGGVGANVLRLARIMNPEIRLLGIVNSEGSSRRLQAENFTTIIGLKDLSLATRKKKLSFDLVFDFSGDEQAPIEGIKILRKGGALILGGISDSVLRLDIHQSTFVTREITVKASYASDLGDLQEVVDLIESKNLSFDTAVTHYFPLTEYDLAFKTLRERPSGLGRIVLIP